MAKQSPSRGPAASSSSSKAPPPSQAKAGAAAATGGERKQDPKKKISKLIDLGKERGYLTYTEVNEAVPRDGSSSEELDSVMSMLGDMDIEVLESMEEEGFTAEAEAEPAEAAEAEPETPEP